MNKQTISLALSLFTGIFLFSINLWADLPTVNQEDDVKQKYHEAITAKHQTLEAPLLTSPSWNDRLRSVEFGAGNMPYKIEHSENLKMQRVGSRVLRLQSANLNKPAMLTWEFEKPVDCKNQWFQIDYTGPKTPGHLILSVKSKAGAPDSRFDVYLEDSLEPQSVRFKLPDHETFLEVIALSFIIDSKEVKRAERDFVILNFAPLPKDADPLAELPSSDLSRFDKPTAVMVL